MREVNTWTAVRWLMPQILTASRVGFSAAAVLAALEQQPELAARLIVLGAVTDMLDGPLAARLGVHTHFGVLFDYFADYLCYVVSPVVLCYTLLPGRVLRLEFILLGLPLLAGAIRYARNGSLALRDEHFDQVGYPGLGTNFYAMFIVGAVLLRWLEPTRLHYVFSLLVPIFSVLMVVRIRYPKLTASLPLGVAVLIYLLLLPFVFTRVLSAGALIVVLAYSLIAPFLVPRESRKASAATGRVNA